MSKERLIEIIKEKSFRTGEFTLVSGLKSDHYIDGKHTTLDPEGSALLAEAILEIVASDSADAIGGLTLGADPMVGSTTAISHIKGTPLKGLIVRKEAKEHGTGNKIEGTLNAGDRVVVVEDVTTTGGSAWKAVESIRASGGEVVRIVTMVDRLQGAGELFAKEGVPFSSVITVRDLGVDV